MYRIRLYIVPEQDEPLNDSVIVTNNKNGEQNQWWNNNSKSDQITEISVLTSSPSLHRRNSKRNWITYTTDAEKNEKKTYFLRKSRQNIDEEVLYHLIY